jgi:hypothetical protein
MANGDGSILGGGGGQGKGAGTGTEQIVNEMHVGDQLGSGVKHIITRFGARNRVSCGVECTTKGISTEISQRGIAWHGASECEPE